VLGTALEPFQWPTLRCFVRSLQQYPRGGMVGLFQIPRCQTSNHAAQPPLDESIDMNTDAGNCNGCRSG
jgi:hypothetical protein